jgi:electron transfer flavoprotein beta subunit
MKAKKKPLDEKAPADYGVDVAPRLTVVKVTEPPRRARPAKRSRSSMNLSKLKEAGVV